MEKPYIVDFVLKVISDISSSKPFLFQRDGALVVASQQGFGYVTPGVQTWLERIASWEKREQPREIRESTEIMRRVKQRGQVICKFTGQEKKYVLPITHSEDTTVFSLKDISTAVEKFEKLPDDGKIRMVSHDSGHHSHKHGYACDGIDVWLTCARVMDRTNYLEIMRQKQDELLEKLENSKADSSEGGCSYARMQIPRAIIFTKNLMASLPLREELSYHREGVASWSEETKLLRQNSNDQLPSTHNESPYGLFVKLNSLSDEIQTTQEYKTLRTKTINGIDRELQVLESHMMGVEAFLGQMNAIHNRVGEKNIAWKRFALSR